MLLYKRSNPKRIQLHLNLANIMNFGERTCQNNMRLKYEKPYIYIRSYTNNFMTKKKKEEKWGTKITCHTYLWSKNTCKYFLWHLEEAASLL